MPGKPKTSKPVRNARQAAKPNEGTVRLPVPSAIKSFLDEYVIGQEEAKKVLSVAVYNHYKRVFTRGNVPGGVELDKSNVVLLGDTGCGKTYLIKTIARMLGVPCYIQDCTKITESGYVGSDVESCLVGLLRECEYDVAKTEMGIVVLDECDKLSKRTAGMSLTRDVGGEGVQQALLKLVEGDVVGVPPFGGRKHPEQPLIYVNTANILFIASGAFVGLKDIISKRLGRSARIGFEDESKSGAQDNPMRYATAHDLRDFGMIPEFVGHFPVITNVEPLSEEDLVTILTKPRNALVKQYESMLAMDGVKLTFSKDALTLIARYASALGTGARGLRTIMEDVMLQTMFEAPQMGPGTKISVTPGNVIERLKSKYGEAPAQNRKK